VVRGRDQDRLLPVPPNPGPVDATGAGDVFVGTTAARLALGDAPHRALATGVAAASLSVSGVGGTGYVPRLEESLALVPVALTGSGEPGETAPGDAAGDDGTGGREPRDGHEARGRTP
jgi:2-dehydro-3-deoxygluconokinase